MPWNAGGKRIETLISNRLRATVNRKTVDTFPFIDRNGMTPDIDAFKKFGAIGIDRAF